jgi:hypothetical protein
MSGSCILCVSCLRRISNLQFLKESPGFESHPHRHFIFNHLQRISGVQGGRRAILRCHP